MRAMIKRVTLPVLLLFGGAGLLVYGAAIHSLRVVEERETEETIVIPSPFEPPPLYPDSPPDFPEPPPFLAGPPPIVEKVIRKTREIKHESEPALIREVTIGGVTLTREESIASLFGVTLLASGELRRTYSGEAPSLCPT